MVGVPGTSLDLKKIDFLGRLGIGGVVLFKSNYESLKQLIELTNAIQKAATAEAFMKLPSLIGVDHEGGRVQRFSAPFTQFPALKKWGDLNSPKTAFEGGYVMAKELRACGVNVNFAPVIDVLGNPASPAIGDRGLSSDPEIVSSVGSAIVRGLLKGGVLPVAKHFPGHGSVPVDSHVDLPSSQATIDELEAKDWIPFRRVIRSRVEGVMTAHILYPKIDADKPATLSRKFLQDVLRKGMRFNKLIFSDDLEMGAIEKRYTLKDAAFLAIEAGCDQILLCHQWDQIEEVWSYLVKAFDSGALSESKLDESIARIRDAKQRVLMPFKFADPDLAQALVGAPDFLEVAKALVEQRSLESGPSTSDTEGDSES